MERTALVTGASGGIGRAIAGGLAQSGVRVALHYDRGEESAEALAAQIVADGGEAFTIRADLREVGAVEELAESVMRRFDAKLDILVNNAGSGDGGGTITQTGEADFDRMIDINVKAPFFLSRALLPQIAQGGTIISISSMVSFVAYPGCIAYSLAKAALNAFTRSLAAELGPRGITVNAVAPGATDTAFIARWMDDPHAKAFLEGQTALGRVGMPEEVAQTVLFLASPAGRWITGQVIQASGGMHL